MNENIINIIKNVFTLNHIEINIKGLEKKPFNMVITSKIQNLKSINKLNLIISWGKYVSKIIVSKGCKSFLILWHVLRLFRF